MQRIYSFKNKVSNHPYKSFLIFFFLAVSSFAIFTIIKNSENSIAKTIPPTTGTQDAGIQSVDDSGVLSQNCTATPDTKNAEEFLQILNEYRAQNNAGPLTLDPVLMNAAAWMSKDMSDNNYMSHTDSLGRSSQERIFTGCAFKGTSYGENVAMSPSSQRTFTLWKNSPDHNANMLDDKFNVAGFAQSRNKFTLDLGTIRSGQGSPVPNSTITPTITSTPSATISPSVTPTGDNNNENENKTIELEFIFPGIGSEGNSNPVESQKEITIKIFDENKNYLKEKNVTADYSNGKYTASLDENFVGNGIHILTAKSANTMLIDVTPQKITLPGSEGEKITFYFVSGDVTNDNVLDILDYNSFLTIYILCQNNTGCTDKLTKADFNSDGKVNGIDYNILLRAFVRLSTKQQY